MHTLQINYLIFSELAISINEQGLVYHGIHVVGDYALQ